MYNALVVSSMMGCTISFTIPFALGVVSSLATSATAFAMMDRMDKKGVVMNSAFAVSGAFIVGSHLAFTMAFNEAYVFPVLLGKMVSGVLAIVLANIIYGKTQKINN